MATNRKYYYDEEEKAAPIAKLDENRNFWKFWLLDVLTFGIYGIVTFMSISFDINKIASRHDGKKTMNYIFALVLAFFTFSIVMLVWFYQLSERITDELDRRQIQCEFSTSDFWTWQIFGSFILIGPRVFHYKLIKAMNLLCKAYNEETEKMNNN